MQCSELASKRALGMHYSAYLLSFAFPPNLTCIWMIQDPFSWLADLDVILGICSAAVDTYLAITASSLLPPLKASIALEESLKGMGDYIALFLILFLMKGKRNSGCSEGLVIKGAEKVRQGVR